MTFIEHLDAHAKKVEDRFETWLTTERLGPVPDRLLSAIRYGSLGGGKRLRPFLVIETAKLFGVGIEQALNAAIALECIHCYSLVHDDLPAMDNDDLRRGRPTVHKAYDVATAILAGDALLTIAFEILAVPETHPRAEVRSELVLHLAKASGGAGMVGGQMLDLEAPGKQLGEAEIRALQRMKTGALITFACESGAILGQADADKREALKQFGSHLGAAFQLADDLLDSEGSSDVVGKATGKDQEAGKGTLVSLFGNEKAREKLSELREEAIASLAKFKPNESMLIAATDFVVGRDF